MEMTIWYSQQALGVMNSISASDRITIIEHLRGYGQPVHVPGGRPVASSIGRFGIASISELDNDRQHLTLFVHAITEGQIT